jgi:hypothetical protein
LVAAATEDELRRAATSAAPVNPDGTATHPERNLVMRRRRIARKAVKTALIVRAAQRLARRTEKHLKKH